MKDFKNGVKYYTMAELNFKFGFPEKETVCGFCPFIKNEYGLNRHRCTITNDLVYSLDNRGKDCPLLITGEVEE